MSEWRALSFSQPWLELVLHGWKRIENRRRCLGRPKLPFILHGAQSNQTEETVEFVKRIGFDDVITKIPASPVAWRRGFCGVARSAGIIRPHEAMGIELAVDGLPPYNLSWWMREQFGYLLADVQPIAHPVPGKGSLGFFRVDPGIVRELGLPPTPEEYLARAA